MQSKPCVAVTQSSCNASSEVLDLLHLPLIHMQALAFDESVLEIEYDWLILTSKNAVDLFMKYKNKVNNCKIASIGEKTTERIKSYGLSVDFEPSVYTQEGFIDEFNVTQSLKVLYPTSKHARNHLYNYLKENHCMVKKIIVWLRK